jgi:hypothetical protein
VQGVNALSPARQAAIWGNLSPTNQYVDGITILTPEQQAAIYAAWSRPSDTQTPSPPYRATN